MSQRKQFIVLAIILVIGMSIAALRSVTQVMRLEAPSVQLQNVELVRLGREQVELVAILGVYNPNSRQISISGLNYRLDVEEENLIDQSTQDRIVLNAGIDEVIRIPLHVNTPNLLSLIRSSRTYNQVGYTFEGTANIELPGLGGLRAPFSKSGTIPVPRLPKVESLRWEVKSLSWRHVDLELNVELYNPNAFDISVDALQYQISLQDQVLSHASLDQASHFSPMQSATITFPLGLDFRELGSPLTSAIREFEAVRYSLIANASLSSSWSVVDGFEFNVNHEGRVTLGELIFNRTSK